MKRSGSRKSNEMRAVQIIPNYLTHAEGSCLVSFGNTKVICAATIENKVPSFLKGSGMGWVTAEYSLLPRSTSTRTEREAVKGKQSGRTQEIQRLIGRSLRSMVNLEFLEGIQIKIDCDVIEADGGTRTAAISGSSVALALALRNFDNHALKHMIAAVSCGVVDGRVLLDLDYNEDFNATVDANFVFTNNQEIVELQASGEKGVLQDKELLTMLEYSRNGLQQVFDLQKEVLAKK